MKWCFLPLMMMMMIMVVVMAFNDRGKYSSLRYDIFTSSIVFFVFFFDYFKFSCTPEFFFVSFVLILVQQIWKKIRLPGNNFLSFFLVSFSSLSYLVYEIYNLYKYGMIMGWWWWWATTRVVLNICIYSGGYIISWFFLISGSLKEW